MITAESDSLDPQRPSNNDTGSGSTQMITAIIVATCTSVPIFAILFSVMCGLMLIKFCRSKSAKSSISLEPFPNEPHLSNYDAQVIPVYETVFPMEFQLENVELNDNIAYGTIHI